MKQLKILLVYFACLAIVTSVNGQYSSYRFLAPSNGNLSSSFDVANLTECTNLCSNGYTAVSFSPRRNKCMTNTCGNLKMGPNALWTTYICTIPYLNGCNLPMAKLQWMMTDMCGLSNTGSYTAGPAMIPSVGFTATFKPSYTVALGNSTGQAIWYPGLPNYVSMTPTFDLKMNFSNSFTLFAYFMLNNVITQSIALIEFGSLMNGAYYCDKQFWIDGGIYANLQGYPADCTGDGCTRSYPLTVVPYKWMYAAVVYDSQAHTSTMYINGQSAGSASALISQASTTINMVVTGARPTSVLNGNIPYGQIAGSTACLKIFEAALTSAQIIDVASSCTLGQISL